MLSIISVVIFQQKPLVEEQYLDITSLKAVFSPNQINYDLGDSPKVSFVISLIKKENDYGFFLNEVSFDLSYQIKNNLLSFDLTNPQKTTF
ncbi:MAG: hypothetical protein IJ730_05080 [Alphaproteobacteria bacterium]|nr:hypothetical protein [Alphaproteobacteria bacterium]